MSPLNWHQIMNVPEDDLSDEQVEEYYTDLLKFNTDDETDARRLQRLFIVTRSVMQVKGMQAEVAIEELEQMAKNQGKMSARREKELTDEIHELQQQLKSASRFGHGGDTQAFKSRLRLEELEHQVEQMKRESNIKNEELDRNKQELEKLLQLSEKNDKERLGLKEEARHLAGELEHCHHKLENQETMVEQAKGKKEQELVQKVKNKNKQIHQLLDDVKQLESENESLNSQVAQMKHKIEDAVNQIESATTDYITLGEAYQQSESILAELSKEREMLQSEVQDLQNQLQLKQDTDNEIMMTVSQRVDEWKSVLISKEEDLSTCQQQIVELKKQLETAKLDSDRAALIALTKAVEERDDQIAMLQSQLEQATQDLEDNTAFLEGLHPHTPSTSRNTSRKVSLALELQASLRDKTQELERMKGVMVHLEEDAERKDKELNQALVRMRQYEMGEYGLADAVGEIKECKNQLRLRDSQIEELTQQLNYAEVRLDEYSEENQMLRGKLNMDLRSEDVQHRDAPKKKLKLRSDVLKEKVEKLEEENLELQHQVHKLSMKLRRRDAQDKQDTGVKELERDTSLQLNDQENSLMSAKHLETLQWLQAENEELHQNFLTVKQENEQLHQGMKEILQELRDKDGKIDMVLKCPTLEKLVQAIEVYEFTGTYDPLWMLKSRVDQLQGENDALRLELKCVKNELNVATVKLRKAESKRESLEREHHSSRSQSLSHGNQTFTLDNNVCGSTTSLDGFQELNADDPPESTQREVVALVEPSVDKPSDGSRFDQFYKQYFADREALSADKDKWFMEKEEVMQESEGNRIKAEQLEELLKKLESSDCDMKQQVLDMNHRITSYLLNESTLVRRFAALQDVENELWKENMCLKKEIIFVETQTMEHIAQLRRNKELTASQLKALQSSLEESVPLTDLELADHRFTELSIKYRELLDKHHSLASLQRQDTALQAHIAKLQNENEMLRNDIAIEKEKLSVLDSVKNTLENGNSSGSSAGNIHQAVLKLKEANERQRADHAVFQYEQLKSSFIHLESRNKELEKTVSEITGQNLQLQATLVELTNKVEGSVPKDVHDLNRDQLRDLESSVDILKQQASEAKSLADVARHQSQFLESANTVLQKELEIVRQQFIDLQEESAEKMNIGKLYRQILSLQLNEATLVQKLDQARSKTVSLEAHCLRQEKKCDELEQQCFLIRSQWQNKIYFLHRVLHELRRQYCEAVPLLKQEKLYKEIQQLKEDKTLICKERLEYLDRALSVESQKEELEHRCKTLEETITTLKDDNETTSRILEWHQRMETLQLQAIRSKKAYERSTSQVQHLESQLQQLEKRISELEEENTRLEKNLWERCLLLEEARDQDPAQEPLRSNVINSVSTPSANNESQAHHETKVAATITRLYITEDDVNLGKSTEGENLREQLLLLQKKLKLSEDSLLKREEALNELRLQIPPSHQVIAFTQQQAEIPLVQHYETKQSLKVSLATISCLQARLSQKSESLSHHQELLSRLRQENTMLQAQHEEEVNRLHEQLQHTQRQALASSNRAVIAQSGLIGDEESPRENSLAKLVTKCAQLEETVSLQERSLSSLSKQLLLARQEAANATEEAQALARTLEAEHNREVEEIRTELLERRSALESKETELAELRNELELERQVVAADVPLKNMVQELKAQLSLKEEQMQMLKESMAELRSEMDEMLKESHPKHISEPGQSAVTFSSKLLENKVKDLQDKVDNLEMQKSRICREVDQKNDSLENLKINMESLKIQLEQKDSILSRTITERDELKRKSDRLKDGNSLSKAEVLELNQQVRYLEEQLQRHLPAEKPFVDDEKAEKSREEIARWEEGKRWQGTVERLRHKLKAKEDEAEQLEKTSKSLREQLVRLGREKVLLENRVKALSQKNSSTESPTIQELKRRNMVLEEQLQVLKKENQVMGSPTELDDLRNENRILLEKLKDMEKQLAKCNLQKEVKVNPSFEESHSELKLKTNLLQKQVIRLNEEKFELKVALERLRVDVPRLQQEKETLESYVTALRADLAQREMTSSGSSIPTPLAQKTNLEDSNIVSGKKTEVAGTNTSKKPFVSSSTNIHTLLNEKTAKIVSENKRQQQELKKLQNEVDKLQHHNRVIEQERRELEVNLEKKSQELTSLRALVPSPHLMNPKQYKTYVVTRIYEGKLKTTEDQLRTKIEQLEDTHKLLQKVTLESESLRTDRNHFREKAEAYENATLITGANLEEQLSFAKSRVIKLESENNELLSKLSGLDLRTDQYHSGIPSYHERLLRENAQLRVQVRVTQMEFQKTLQEVKKLREDVEHAQQSFKSCESQNFKLLEQNKSYEDQLKQMSKQFGFSSV